MNSEGQIILEIFFVTFVVLIVVFVAITALQLQRGNMHHEKLVSSAKDNPLELNLTSLKSNGLMTFKNQSTQKNVDTLMKENWEVEKKFKDSKGDTVFLLHREGEKIIVNKNIGIKVWSGK